jgi:hypothetical protein
MISPRFNVNDPDRARMLELAMSLEWPRVKLRQNGAGVSDFVGPGVTAWYLLAEQMSSTAIAEATRALLAPPAATPDPTLSADAPVLELPEPGWSEGINGPSKMVELYAHMEATR